MSRRSGSPSGSATAACGACPSPSPARRPRGSRRRPCARSRCRPAARPCARPRPRCAASPARRWSRRRTPARAARTAWPARCGRCSRWMSRSRVVRSSGGNLYAIAHRGALLVNPAPRAARDRRPSRPRRRSRSRGSDAAPPSIRRTRRPTRDRRARAMSGFTWKPSSRSQSSVCRWVRSTGPPVFAPSW